MSQSPAKAHLPRLKPSPIPEIFPLPEYLAEGDRKADYEDTKAILQVPWMGVVTMAFSHYRHFYKGLWGGARAIFQSAEAVRECERLRGEVEALVGELSPVPLLKVLRESNYAPREIQQIRDMITIFHVGNFPYALMASMGRLLLDGQELSSLTAATPFTGIHTPQVSVPFVLMEAHHADEPTRQVYADIKAQLGLPLVNTDYRAFARWPSYFAEAWACLRPHVTTPHYEGLVKRMHERIVETAASLPNPNGLTSAALKAALANEANPEQVLRTVQLFQWLLPGLIVNVAYFRAQLLEG